MPENQNFAKQIILEFLDFIRYKIENDKLTLEEAESIAKTIQCNMSLTGTAGDVIASPTNLKDCCSITNAVSLVGSFNLATA